VQNARCTPSGIWTNLQVLLPLQRAAGREYAIWLALVAAVPMFDSSQDAAVSKGSVVPPTSVAAPVQDSITEVGM